MRRIGKIILSLLVIFTTLFSINSHLYKVEAAGISDIISGANDFVSKGEADQTDTINKDKLLEGASLIYSIFMAIGIFLATVVGIIVGIKLMAAGSAEEKAQYKKILEVYIAGCIIIFGAVGIWRLVINTINGATPTASAGGGSSQPTTTSTPSTQPANQQTEEEKLDEFIENVTAAQEGQIRSRAIQKMKENGMNVNPSSGATSVPNSQAVDIPDKYYREAAKEIMNGK